MPGIPLLEKVDWFRGFWFLGFLVAAFLGFKDSWFLGFKDYQFLGFKASKIYEMPIPCFLEDIDPISKIFKILLDAWSACAGARLCGNCQNVGILTN